MVSSDRITLYIGTYTRRESFVDGKAEGIYIYHLDLRSGALTYAATVAGPGTINPSFVTLSPDKRCSVRGQRDHRRQGTAWDDQRLCRRSDNRAPELSEPAIDPWPGALLCQHRAGRTLLPGGQLRDRQPVRFADPGGRQPGRRQPMSCSFPVPGQILSARKARMPTWFCLAPMAASSWRLTWARTG